MTSVMDMAQAVSKKSNRPGTPGAADQLLTTREVAEAMRVSNMTVYRLIKTGQLEAVRVGKNYRIRASQLDRYLFERTVRVEGMA